MNKLKIVTVAAVLGIVTEIVVMRGLPTEGAAGRLCAIVEWPPAFLAGLVGMFADKLVNASGTAIILTFVFSFLWFFGIFVAILGKAYGRKAV